MLDINIIIHSVYDLAYSDYDATDYFLVLNTNHTNLRQNSSSSFSWGPWRMVIEYMILSLVNTPGENKFLQKDNQLMAWFKHYPIPTCK